MLTSEHNCRYWRVFLNMAKCYTLFSHDHAEGIKTSFGNNFEIGHNLEQRKN